MNGIEKYREKALVRIAKLERQRDEPKTSAEEKQKLLAKIVSLMWFKINMEVVLIHGGAVKELLDEEN